MKDTAAGSSTVSSWARHLLWPARAVRRRWRASLQLRVVTATVMLGLTVVIVVGNFLYQRIADGLIESRRRVVQADASRLAADAQKALDAADKVDPESMNAQLRQLAIRLRLPAGEGVRYVVLARAQSNTAPDVLPNPAYGDVSARYMPQDLRDHVNNEPATAFTRLATLPLPRLATLPLPTPGQTQERPAIVVGQILRVRPYGDYELYFIYPLDREAAIVDVVRRTFIFGGFALVALVAGVAVMVTRQVVAPVRQAARTAEELASGRFDRRMRVRGEDDLARLGRAFNEMAAGLERQINQLEELSRVQRQFVSDVSHELRTPLTTIRMAGEVLYESRGALDPAGARSAELLQAQLDRFESLLSDLLEISRYDAGAAVLDLEQVDVREIVVRVLDGLSPLADRRGSAVVLDAPAQPCVAEVDPRRVARVVRNLVGNAIEHGEGGRIDVSIAMDEAALAIGVRDHGVGLQPTHLERVFTRFWRADPARARTMGGTGLGLAISLEDAALHGGRLEVWGRPGLGANFRLTLPRHGGAVLLGSPLPLLPRDAGVDNTKARTPRPVWVDARDG